MIRKYWKKYLCNAVFVIIAVTMLLFCITEFMRERRTVADASDYGHVIETEISAGNIEAVSDDLASGEEGYLDIEAYAKSDGGYSGQGIKLYTRDNDCYFFMPSYCVLNDIVIKYDKNKYDICLDGEKLSDDTKIKSYDNAEYDMEISCGEQKSTYTLHIMKSDKLPAVFISTANKTMDFINEDKDIKEPGMLVCINSDGSVDCEGALDAVRARGKSSFLGDVTKKSYQVKFSEDRNLLSMGSAKTWVLQANAYDASRLRNKFVYDMAAQLGLMYAVDSESVDMYFNGEYAGNYLICEKIEADVNRVDIEAPNFESDAKKQEIWDLAELVSDDDCRYYSFLEELDYDAGYLLELQTNVDEDKCYFTSCGRQYEIRSPQKVSKSEIDYLADYISTIDSLIEGCYDEKSYNELKAYIDIDSFAIKYIVDIMANEPDTNHRSTYFYIKPSNDNKMKLFAGPVWDFDRAMGNDIRGVNTQLNCFENGWCEKLYMNERFKETVKNIFNERMKSMFGDDMNDWWDSNIQSVHKSLELDKARWEYIGSEKEDAGGSYVSIDDEFEYLKYYCNERFGLLNNLLNNDSYVSTITFTDGGDINKNAYVKRGEIPAEDIFENMKGMFGCIGWKLAINVPAYTPVRPIYDDIVLYAVYE